MPWRGKACAYLVVPFALSDDGMWARQAETICFDHDLAVDIAETESEHAAGVGIYPLGADGCYLTCAPIAWYGAIQPPMEAGNSTALALSSTIRLDCLAASSLGALQLH
ncbi:MULTISPECIES: hypothetical protein [unclassified Xanthobacter]|uniref:hypothetical protein n=1 Tax=unclassified Xanthobacter TaxID=2623496 RepID=UPI001F4636CE|nr:MULTISPECIES: hypothetical protein [unclassified Xanthobacter]